MAAVKTVSSYGHGYGYGHRIQFVAVEPQVDYYLNLAGYGIRQRQAQSEAESIVDELKGIKKEIANLRAGSGSAGHTPPTGTDGDVDERPADPPVSGGSDLETTAVGWLRTACAKCHSGQQAKGAFQMFESDGQTALQWTAPRLILIDQVVYENSMPPSPNAKATAEQYNSVRAWMSADYGVDVKRYARDGLK